MKAEREKINAKVKADTVRLDGSKLELTADEEMCTFLLVSEGSCTLQMGENDLLLNPGSALLLGAGLLCGRSCTGLRLCVGSAAAAASTLALLAPPWPAPLAILYKIASCCGVVAVCYGVPGARSFARLCGWYAALNGLLCGAVVLPGVQANNLSVLLPVRPGRLLPGCMRCCAGCWRCLAARSGAALPPCFTLRERLCPCRPTMTPALPCKTLLPGGGWCWCSIRRCAAGCPRRCGKP